MIRTLIALIAAALAFSALPAFAQSTPEKAEKKTEEGAKKAKKKAKKSADKAQKKAKKSADKAEKKMESK